MKSLAATILAILVFGASPAGGATLCDSIGNMVDVATQARDRGLSKGRVIELAESDALNSEQVKSIWITVINSIYDAPEVSPDAVRATICHEVTSGIAHGRGHSHRGGDNTLEIPAP